MFEERNFIIKRNDIETKEDIELHGMIYKNKKTNKAILICHGMFGDKNEGLVPIIYNHLKEDYNVIKFDFSGNGESTGEWNYAGYQREVRDIATIVKYIKYAAERENLEIYAIIGHSKAGADVFLSAMTPGICDNKNCCFISLGGRITFGKPEKRFTKEELETAYKKGFFMWEHNGKKWKITKESLIERKTMNPKLLIKNLSEERKDRILQIHGTIDTSTPIQEADVIINEIKGSHLKWIEGANHFFKGKEIELCQAIYEFLKEKI